MYGYRLNNFITEEISNIGVQTSIKECLLRKPHCQSINYNTQQFRCEVNSKGADILLKGTPDVNSIFAYLANVSKDFSTNCKDKVCQPLHKCVAMKNTHVCISTDSCKPCPSGYHQYTTGQAACIFCSYGTYQDLEGQFNCKDCNDFHDCANRRRTNCFSLIKHVGQIGINGLSYGKHNRHDCKAICQLDRTCKGFSLVDGVTKVECFTHTQIDHTTSISDFYEFPTECLV
ncbi:uncharacterized protein [Magallana gigas]|uniref:uncharacterized protein isoform X2 n=1 Tax=Magallana gigas TaxID=29159 RepID=UPI00333F0F8C